MTTLVRVQRASSLPEAAIDDALLLVTDKPGVGVRKTSVGGLRTALLANSALTGAPTAPAPAQDDSSQRVVNSAWYAGQAGGASPLVNGTAAPGVSLRFARQDHVHPIDATRAPIASPTLTGTPSAPTPPLGTDSARIQTAAGVLAEIAAGATRMIATNDTSGALARTVASRAEDALWAADFGVVCDGSAADATRLGNAIAAAANAGKVLRLRRGLHVVSATPTIVGKSGFGIVGEPGTVFSIRSSTTIQFLRLEACSDVLIEGITFDNQASGYSGSFAALLMWGGERITIRNCFFTRCYGVVAENGASRVLIDGNRFRDVGVALQLGQGESPKDETRPLSRDITFVNNLVIAATAEAIEFNYRFRGCIVANNHFIDCGSAVAEVMDIGGGDCGDILVTDNIIENSGRFLATTASHAIKIKVSNGGQADNSIISNNRIFGSIGVGIFAEGLINRIIISQNVITDVPQALRIFGEGHSVVGNIVHNGGASLLQCTNVSFIGNRLSLADLAAVSVSSSSGVTIAANAITRTGASGNAVEFVDTSRSSVKDNSVSGGGIELRTGTGTDNRVSGNVTDRYIVTTNPRSVVSGNTVSGTGLTQIDVRIAAVGSVVIGNTTTNFDIGITVSAENCVVSGNNCSDAIGGGNSIGINVNASATGAVITANNCSDTRGTRLQRFGIALASGLSNAVIRDNICRRNLNSQISGLGTLGAGSQGSASDNILSGV